MEVRFLANTYITKMTCEKCGIGDMAVDKTEPVIATDPPKYFHRCTNPECNNAELYLKPYPVLEYQLIDLENGITNSAFEDSSM